MGNQAPEGSDKNIGGPDKNIRGSDKNFRGSDKNIRGSDKNLWILIKPQKRGKSGS